MSVFYQKIYKGEIAEAEKEYRVPIGYLFVLKR